MNKILQKIQDRLNKDTFLDQLANELSGSAFNSLLLEVFQKRTKRIKPAQLLKEFEQNRFVQPANVDPIKSRETELEWLKYAEKQGFPPITLSPVSPLGTCASMGTVHQNKVLSSLRGTEVVADATNVLALKIAQDFKGETDKEKVIKYATVHRHVRGQYFDNPNFSAHFAVFCMISGGFDRGSYSFELSQLNQHISIILALLKDAFPTAEKYLKFYLKEENEQFSGLLNEKNQAWSKLKYEFVTDLENKYYQRVQFKIFIRVNDMEMNIADGGMVDWTQKIIGNKKHRVVISGTGIELIQKLLNHEQL